MRSFGVASNLPRELDEISIDEYLKSAGFVPGWKRRLPEFDAYSIMRTDTFMPTLDSFAAYAETDYMDPLSPGAGLPADEPDYENPYAPGARGVPLDSGPGGSYEIPPAYQSPSPNAHQYSTPAGPAYVAPASAKGNSVIDAISGLFKASGTAAGNALTAQLQQRYGIKPAVAPKPATNWPVIIGLGLGGLALVYFVAKK